MPTPSSRRSRRWSTRPPTTRSSSSPRTASACSPRRTRRCSTCRRPWTRCWRRRSGPRTAPHRSRSPRRRPSAPPRTRWRWASPGSSRATRPTTAACRTVIHNVQVVAHLVDNTLIPPGKEFSFNGTTGERNAAKGLLEAPVIINGELAERARRRHLPGLDHRVQRGVRGRPADHGSDEPRPLHQPLPPGPRRHRQLPRHRSQVRERHGPLAAAAHVRQLELADGEPVRDAAAPQGRQRDVAAGDHRACAADDHEGPEPARRREGGRPAGIAAALDQREPQASTTRRRQAALRRRPGTRVTSARRRDPRRDEAEAEAQAEAQAEGGCDDDADRAERLPADDDLAPSSTAPADTTGSTTTPAATTTP